MTVKLRGPIIKNGIKIASLIIFNVVSRVFWTMYTLEKHLGKFSWFQQKLTLSWRRSLSYRNQSIDLHSKSMDWSLNNRYLGHERVSDLANILSIYSLYEFKYYCYYWYNKRTTLKNMLSLREKCPNIEFFSGSYFPVFGLNTEIY